MYYYHVICVTGLHIPACLMVSTSYVDCNSTTLAFVLFSLALGASDFNGASYTVNHFDIAPRFAGGTDGNHQRSGYNPWDNWTLCSGTVHSNQVCCWSNYCHVFVSQVTLYLLA